MLSLIGSLQSNPFSPEHVPRSAITSQESKLTEEAGATEPLAELDDEDDFEEDPFEIISKARRDATERQEVMDAAAAPDEKDRKRKRKEERRARKAQKADKAAARSEDTIPNPADEKTKKKRKRGAQEG